MSEKNKKTQPTEKDVIASYVLTNAEEASAELQKFAQAVFFDTLARRGYVPNTTTEAQDFIEAGEKIASEYDIFTVPDSAMPRSLGELAKKASGVETPAYYQPSEYAYAAVDSCFQEKYATLLRSAQISAVAGELLDELESVE